MSYPSTVFACTLQATFIFPACLPVLFSLNFALAVFAFSASAPGAFSATYFAEALLTPFFASGIAGLFSSVCLVIFSMVVKQAVVSL